MKSALIYQFCLIAILLLPGCTSTSSTSPQPQLTAETASVYRTFSIAPLPTQGPSTDPGAAVRLAEVGRAAIVETLTAKGYTEAGAGEADFIVKVQTDFSQDPLIENSEKRHITIAFHDGRSDAVVWSKQRGRSSSRTLEPELLRKSIQEMLASVPSASGR